MNNFFYKLTFVILSSLGIGFLSRFREIIACFLSTFIVFILPDSLRPLILFFLILLFILFFALTYPLVLKDEKQHNRILVQYQIGIWLSMVSPIMMFTVEWIITALVVYAVLRTIINGRFPQGSIRNGRISYLKVDFLSGLITSIFVQIIYSGYNMLDFVRKFSN